MCVRVCVRVCVLCCACWIDALNHSGSAASDVYGASLGVSVCVCVHVYLRVCGACVCWIDALNRFSVGSDFF